MLKRSRRILGVAMPTTIALAMLAACNGQAPQAIQKEGVVKGAEMIGDVAKDNASVAKRLGMVEADRGINADQFQVKDTAGRALPGATVLIGDLQLVADAKGFVTLPAAQAIQSKTLAMVKAAGYAPMSLDVTPGFAIALTPIDAQRTSISASSGGVAMNAAGSMQMVFPPGALTGDASVAITKIVGENGLPGQTLPEQIPFKVSANKDSANPLSLADAGYKLADNAPLGTYHYALDLPAGVEVAPGAEVVVKFKAEGHMKALLDLRAKGGDKFDNTTESISKDTNGDYWLAMRFYGPKLAEGQAAPTRKLMAAACDTYSDQEPHTFLVQKQWSSLTPGIEVPIYVNGHRERNDVSANELNSYASYSGGHCVGWESAYQYESPGYNMAAGSSIPGWVTVMTHNGALNGGRCIYFQFDPAQYFCQDGQIYVKDPGQEWQTTYTTWISKTINALVTWDSDDPRIAGVVPNARVDFSHSLAPVRNNVPMSVFTGNDGFANTVGVDSSYGTATASLPAQSSFTYGSQKAYNVDCRTVGLSIVKKMPKVNVTTNQRGEWTAAAPIATNLGDYSLANPAGAVVKPTIDVNSASSPFQINGSRQPDSGTWIDASSGSATASWNGSVNLAADLWISKQITAVATYLSNDNDTSVPADQRPGNSANLWGNQDANGATIKFAHAQSTYGNKAASRSEALQFDNARLATTWGLSGAASTIAASKAGAGFTLTGGADGKVDGRTVQVKINANLPSLSFTFDGESGRAFVLRYRLKDAGGTARDGMLRLPPTSGGRTTVFLPIEEAVGSAGNHELEVVSLYSEDGAHVMQMPDGSLNYPKVSGLHRGAAYEFPAKFKGELIAPK